MNEHPRVWSLQEAKARFSEVVRRAESDGPQKITLHGRHAATLIPAAMDVDAQTRLTGQALIDAMQACPNWDEFPLVAAGERMTISDPVEI